MGPAPAVAAVRRAVRASLAGLPAVGGAPVLVACSGGADSLALAAATAVEAPRAGLRAAAVTVDHGLQPGSGARAGALVPVLSGLGLAPVEVVPVAVAHGPGSGGPEAAARAARYAALAAATDRIGAVAVLLGHTRDDQAETVLLGLARGSGARSLAGMAPVTGRWRRPLLDLDRATVRAACAAAGLVPWDDPHNVDPAYTRARVRSRALPALEEALGRAGTGAVTAALARTARLLRDDADALDAWAGRVAAEATGPDGTLTAAVLEPLPPAVRRRVLRSAALAAGAPGTDLTAGHLEALDALLACWHGQGPVDLPGGVRARRRCGRLTLARHGGAGGSGAGWTGAT